LLGFNGNADSDGNCAANGRNLEWKSKHLCKCNNALRIDGEWRCLV